MSAGVESLCKLILIIRFFSSSKYLARKIKKEKRDGSVVLVTALKGVCNRIVHIRNYIEILRA